MVENVLELLQHSHFTKYQTNHDKKENDVLEFKFYCNNPSFFLLYNNCGVNTWNYQKSNKFHDYEEMNNMDMFPGNENIWNENYKILNELYREPSAFQGNCENK